MTLKTFLQTFDLVLGMAVALILGAVGGALIYVAWHLWEGVFWMAVIGTVLVLIALLMLVRRVRFLRILDFFTFSTWS
jgi:hypothetical protein